VGAAAGRGAGLTGVPPVRRTAGLGRDPERLLQLLGALRDGSRSHPGPAATTAFTPVIMTWHIEVSVDCTVPTGCRMIGPSSGSLFSWATTSLAIWPPVMTPLPVAGAPSGIAGAR